MISACSLHAKFSLQKGDLVSLHPLKIIGHLHPESAFYGRQEHATLVLQPHLEIFSQEAVLLEHVKITEMEFSLWNP